MQIGLIECGDGRELSQEEFDVLLEMIRERQLLNAEREARRLARRPDAQDLQDEAYRKAGLV